MIIVLVQLDLAMGNHTTKHHSATLTAIQFGDNNHRRDPESMLDSETTDYSRDDERSKGNVIEETRREYVETEAAMTSISVAI